jgi:uncharacterized protein (TIGR02996 family)
MERNRDLEAKLLANPDNTDAYLVYADFLQSKGDPRGELITLQHAGKTEEANAYLEKHADAIYGPVLKNYRKTFDGEDENAFEWRLGFIRSARLSYDSNLAEEVDVDEDVEISLETGLTELLKSPIGMLLEEIVIPINMLDDGAYFEPLVKVITEFGAPALKSLRIGMFDCAGGPGGEGNYEYEISWTTLGDASGLWKSVPRLERLVLQVGLGSTSASGTTDNLGRIDLPKLRHLQVITGGLSESCVKSLAEANLPELNYMDVWFGSDSYGAGGGVDEIAPILEGTKFPKLEHLGLMNAQFTDDICDRLGSAKILPRLKEVSLKYGTMSDAGARALASSKAQLKHLAMLDVSANCLSPEGVAVVEGICANVKSDEQKGSAEDDRYVSLSE